MRWHVVFLALSVSLFSPSVIVAQVDEAALTSTLLNRKVAPAIEIGYTGQTANPMLVNGRPAQFSVKTQIFPDGHEHFRIESGILRADAARYYPFKAGLEFAITKVGFSKDHLEVVLSPITGGQQKGFVQFMMEKGWQQSLNNATILKTIDRLLQIDTDPSNLTSVAAIDPAKAEHMELAGGLMPTDLTGTTVIAIPAVCRNFFANASANGTHRIVPAITIIDPQKSGATDCTTDPDPKLHGNWNWFSPGDNFTLLELYFKVDRQRGDSVEIKFRPSGPSVTRLFPEETNNLDVVRIILPANWQSTMKQDDIRNLVYKYFPDKVSYEAAIKEKQEKDAAEAVVAAERRKANEAAAQAAEVARIKSLRRETTVLSDWSIIRQSQRPGIPSDIKATARINGIEGATIEETMNCSPNEDSTNIADTKIYIYLNLKGASFDKSKQGGGTKAVYQMYLLQDDAAWSVQMEDSLLGESYCSSTWVFGGGCASWDRSHNEPIPTSASYWMPASDLATTKRFYSNMLVVDHGLVELKMNRSQPVLDSFLKSCNRLTPKQERLKNNR